MYRKILYSIFLIVLGACSSQRNMKSKDDIENLVVEKSNMNDKSSCQNNSTEEFKLCQYYKEENNIKYTSFKVFKITSDELIYEQNKVLKVSWNSNFEIRVDNFTRIPKGRGTDDYYLYDVQKRTKVFKNKL